MMQILVHIVCSSYKTLLLCTVQLVVQSVLSVLDTAAQAIAVAVHDAAHALHDVLTAAGEAGVGLADIAVDGLNGVLGLTGHTVTPPTWHEPDALRYVTDTYAGRSAMSRFPSLSLIRSARSAQTFQR